MLHGAIFLATCNAILLLRDVKLPNTSLHLYTPLMFSGINYFADLRMTFRQNFFLQDWFRNKFGVGLG